MADRRQAGSGQMRRGGRAHTSASVSSAPSLAVADLLYHWEGALDGSGLITVVGGNVSQLNERIGGTAHWVQGTAGNRPQYSAAGGPNGLPCITLQDDQRFLLATISVAAGNRAGIVVVCKSGGNNGFLTWRVDHSGAGQSRLSQGATAWQHRAEFTTGTQAPAISSPARDTNWHMHALLPLATGALSQIDGSTVTTNFTGTSTFTEITASRAGGAAGTSDTNTSIWAMFIINEVDATKYAAVKDYVSYYTGLTIA